MYLNDKDIKALKIILQNTKIANVRPTGKKARTMARATKQLNRVVRQNHMKIRQQQKMISKMFDDEPNPFE